MNATATALTLHNDEVAPDPRVVRYSIEARARWEDHAETTSNRRHKDTEIDGAIWARVAERSAKLALLFACSRDRGSKIELCDMDLAIKLSNWLARLIILNCNTSIAGENTIEDNHRRIYALIAAAGPKGISKSILCRRSQWIRQRDRQEVLEFLLYTESIEQRISDSSSAIWFAVKS